jgi:hypothetical protein
MTAYKLYSVVQKAARELKHRGYKIVRSVTPKEWSNPETFVCKRGTADTLHVKLRISPNTLTTGPEIAKYCDEDIRVLRRLMRSGPKRPGEHYEVLVAMPFGSYSAIEVLPDALIDRKTGNTLSLGSFARDVVS